MTNPTNPSNPSGAFRLPDCWSTPEAVEDIIDADGVAIHRAGLSTIALDGDGEEVCGSAADPVAPTLSRAWFELLERVSALETLREKRDQSFALVDQTERVFETRSFTEIFPESDTPGRWRYARSNGVALHVGWRAACERAHWELAERDRVIRSWHGEIAPKRLDLDVASMPITSAPPATMSYEWRAYTFPENDPRRFSYGVEVVGVFAFPRCADLPFVLGFAGRTDVAQACAAATGEALQLLAFLWGEPLPDEVAAASVSAPSAMQHLDAYQVRGRHEVVKHWLEGAHLAYWSGADHSPLPAVGDDATGGGASVVRFIDLTPTWLPDTLRVAKAVANDATPMIFGDSPSARHLPSELRLHPIP